METNITFFSLTTFGLELKAKELELRQINTTRKTEHINPM